jgi:uncharacterized protein GlcG (DUF336 family)
MTSRRAVVLAALATAPLSALAQSQTRPPTPQQPTQQQQAGASAPLPPATTAPLTEKNVSMKMALAIVEGALDQCAKDGYKVSVVVLSNDGVLRAALRGDGTAPHTLEFARRKAYTARTRNMTSLAFQKQTDDPAAAYLKQIPEVVAVGGGVPIRVGNTPIGAVGVSGAPGGDKDEVCANAGIAKVADQLK